MFQSLSSPQSTEEREDVFRRTNELMATFMLKGSMLWTADIIATIGHLDLNKIGVFGMSPGGTATCQACLQDKRIKAGINMDGGILGDILAPLLPNLLYLSIVSDIGIMRIYC